MHQLKKWSSLLVAYSGGVDSTFLLAVAHEVMGDKVVAATATVRTRGITAESSPACTETAPS